MKLLGSTTRFNSFCFRDEGTPVPSVSTTFFPVSVIKVFKVIKVIKVITVIKVIQVITVIIPNLQIIYMIVNIEL